MPFTCEKMSAIYVWQSLILVLILQLLQMDLLLCPTFAEQAIRQAGRAGSATVIDSLIVDAAEAQDCIIV